MSTPLASRYGSPRSPERPYAFTGAELLQGGARALWYVNLGVMTTLVLIGVGFAIVLGRFDDLGFSVWFLLVFGPMFLLPASVIALLVLGLPLAYLLGKALQSVTRRAVHLAAFAGLGAVVGFGSTIAFWFAFLPSGFPALAVDPGLYGFAALVAAVTAAACATAWWRTARSAQRKDALLDHGIRSATEER